MKPDLDKLIVAVAATRDREAFSTLFRYFAPRLKAYLVRFGTPVNLAEELTQEAMASLWLKAASFDPRKASANAWVFTIARNLRLDQVRRDKVAVSRPPDPSDEPEHPPLSDNLLVATERDRKVREALEVLSDEQRSIVQLSFFSDLPHAEIARDLGLPLGTVKSRARLALKRLRLLLGEVS